MRRRSTPWATLADSLFPAQEAERGALSDQQRPFVAVCALAARDQQMGIYSGHRLGRKKKPRVDFAKAFVAKVVYNFETTRMLLEYLRSCDARRRSNRKKQGQKWKN